jgi:hypothetical protein
MTASVHLNPVWRRPLAGLVIALALCVSTAAHADRYWHHGYGQAYGHERHHWRDGGPRVVQPYYYAPAPAYVVPPPVYVAPSYPVYTAPPVYYSPPAYYSAPVYGGRVYSQTYPYDRPYYRGGGYANGERLLPRAVLGAAGGLLGSQIGHGDGRAAATAAGAIAGWVLGGNLAD